MLGRVPPAGMRDKPSWPASPCLPGISQRARRCAWARWWRCSTNDRQCWSLAIVQASAKQLRKTSASLDEKSFRLYLL